MREHVRPTAAQAQINLHTVLQLVAAGRLRCSQTTRRPAAATVAAIAEVLDDGDFYPDEPIAAFAWPLLLQAGGLAELASGRLQLTDRGRAALAKPAAATIRQLWRSWITTTVLDELTRVDEIKGQRAANVLTSVKTRRKAVATALAGCPRDEWIAVDDLFATMRRKRETSPTIARSERALWKLYLVDPQYGSLGYSGFADWPILEGRYTLAVVFEYAATLGLIDIDYTDPAGARTDYHDNWGSDDLDCLSRYDGLLAIRLNPLGAHALGLTGNYQPPASTTAPERTLKVLPTLDIVAVGDPTAADRLILDAHAEHTSDRVWTVRANTLLAAVDTGRQLGHFVAFLTDRATHDLPAALAVLVDDVTTRATRIRDGGLVRLVECADAPLAALIARDPKLRTLCTLVGDHHLAVPVEHEKQFRRTLRTLGHTIATPTG
ncbi:helicase-associated domain-containing protein [Micromonospora sp. U21]|uniref:helicase-associated domain-containing protein n=1 Tax=Micromonospora sp. U21 TaxID=2824899 RepID=UPI001B37EF86|nr:helicase-associated domain-containing protein [Micromonospora sp. U21]MBQ0905569.1 helicase-associated domain-containing protein [Micromonospora sp. U21]